MLTISMLRSWRCPTRSRLFSIRATPPARHLERPATDACTGPRSMAESSVDLPSSLQLAQHVVQYHRQHWLREAPDETRGAGAIEVSQHGSFRYRQQRELANVTSKVRTQLPRKLVAGHVGQLEIEQRNRRREIHCGHQRSASRIGSECREVTEVMQGAFQ